MPSHTQNMFEREFGNYTNSHSKSSATRLADAYAGSPIHSGEATVIGLDAGIPELTRQKVKEWYEQNVLSGPYPEHSDFSSDESNYDYSGAPAVPADVKPEGEADPGDVGSSIASSGKVPNVATLGDGTGVPDLASSAMVDASEASSPAPFIESVRIDPKDSSDSQGSATPLTQPSGLGSYGN